jgi:AcrR family transcriptional regulator
MPKVSTAHRSERRDQILDAAVRCFAATGFHATGMADVVRESGLSAGSVYRYYRSKDDLIGSIIERLLERLQADLTDVSARVETVPAMLERAISIAEQTFGGERGDYARLLPQVWTEALRNPLVATRVRGAYARIFDRLEEFVVRLKASDALPDELDPRGAAHVLLAILQGYMLQRLIVGTDIEPGSYVGAARVLLQGVGLESDRAEGR